MISMNPIAVIRELLRITRVGGEIMIQAWALEQDPAGKRNFNEQDVFVPWKLQQRFFADHQRQAVSESREQLSQQEREQEQQVRDDGAGGRIIENVDCEHVVEDTDGSLVFQRYCHVR